MNILLLVGLMILNFGISWWNAYACGRYLTETKIIGGWSRFTTWCGLVMSACGFTWVYLIILVFGGVAIGKIDQKWAETALNLGYLIIILPVLGSGLGIWGHSVVEAYRRRSFGSIAVAGWNTFAQVHNTWEAARHAPSAFKQVVNAFSDDDEDFDIKALIIALVILALAGGILTTAAIARRADRKVAVEVGHGKPPAAYA